MLAAGIGATYGLCASLPGEEAIIGEIILPIERKDANEREEGEEGNRAEEAALPRPCIRLCFSCDETSHQVWQPHLPASATSAGLCQTSPHCAPRATTHCHSFPCSLRPSPSPAVLELPSDGDPAPLARALTRTVDAADAAQGGAARRPLRHIRRLFASVLPPSALPAALQHADAPVAALAAALAAADCSTVVLRVDGPPPRSRAAWSAPGPEAAAAGAGEGHSPALFTSLLAAIAAELSTGPGPPPSLVVALPGCAPPPQRLARALDDAWEDARRQPRLFAGSARAADAWPARRGADPEASLFDAGERCSGADKSLAGAAWAAGTAFEGVPATVHGTPRVDGASARRRAAASLREAMEGRGVDVSAEACAAAVARVGAKPSAVEALLLTALAALDRAEGSGEAGGGGHREDSAGTEESWGSGSSREGGPSAEEAEAVLASSADALVRAHAEELMTSLADSAATATASPTERWDALTSILASAEDVGLRASARGVPDACVPLHTLAPPHSGATPAAVWELAREGWLEFADGATDAGADGQEDGQASDPPRAPEPERGRDSGEEEGALPDVQAAADAIIHAKPPVAGSAGGAGGEGSEPVAAPPDADPDWECPVCVARITRSAVAHLRVSGPARPQAQRRPH